MASSEIQGEDYAALAVVEGMPDYFHGPSSDEDVCLRLSGAKIAKFGSTPEKGIEGGGLILDYKLGRKQHRLVFGCSELGMWIIYDSFKECPTLDESQ